MLLAHPEGLSSAQHRLVYDWALAHHVETVRLWLHRLADSTGDDVCGMLRDWGCGWWPDRINGCGSWVIDDGIVGIPLLRWLERSNEVVEVLEVLAPSWVTTIADVLSSLSRAEVEKPASKRAVMLSQAEERMKWVVHLDFDCPDLRCRTISLFAAGPTCSVIDVPVSACRCRSIHPVWCLPWVILSSYLDRREEARRNPQRSAFAALLQFLENGRDPLLARFLLQRKLSDGTVHNLHYPIIIYISLKRTVHSSRVWIQCPGGYPLPAWKCILVHI